MLDWVAGPDFDRLLIDTVRSVYPAHEQDQFIAHLRGLLGLWVRDESSRVTAANSEQAEEGRWVATFQAIKITGEDRRNYRAKLARSLDVFARMLQERMFETDPAWSARRSS